MINSLTMCLSKIVLWCFMLLLVASVSKSQENFMNGDERSNNSMEYDDPFVSSVKCRNNEMELTQRNLCENFTKNDKIHYEFSDNSTKNDRKNDDSMLYKSHTHVIKNRGQNNQMSMESYANSTEIIDSMLQEINENVTTIAGDSDSTNKLYGNSNINDYNNTTVTIVPNEACNNIICIQLCCPFGEDLSLEGYCVPGDNNRFFPHVYGKNEMLNELFPVTVSDPCLLYGNSRKLLNPNNYVFLVNGSLHDGAGIPIKPKYYCFAAVYKERNTYDVIVCTYPIPKPSSIPIPIYTISVFLMLSLPFFLLTFVVYSILPELQNMHGYISRAYVASSFITYVIMYVDTKINGPEWKYCIPLAYIFNFSLLSSYFWLNVTCFDIWWTFRGLRSSKQNLKQDKKRFVMYSLYAFGISFILNVIYAIMDYAPGIPENLIRPQICESRIGIGEDIEKTIYIYIPVGVTVISNIYFFIATSLTILYLNIHTAHHMTESESKYYNENKERFHMYLKLFALVAIIWFTQFVISIAVPIVPNIIYYPLYIINAFQGVIIFILFVCTKKNKQLLLKQFRKWKSSFRKIPTNDNTTNTITSSLPASSMSMSERQIPLVRS